MAVSDDVLLAAVAVGDGNAMTTFTRRYQARVFGLARSVVGDPETAADVAQEAFIRAWRHAGAYDARRGSALGWLLVITRNLAIDARRMRRPEPLDPDILANLELESIGLQSSPAASAELSHDVSRLRAALARLPVGQRRALVLATIGGRTALEVSDAEGIPLGTAKTRIRTALIRMRDALADQDVT
ncbi:MAG: sigma-70 family RNA polymerase sigma factor [Actinomycetota bacterium]|nr:sigma-70 family RNA polymerase sigma factor [Actinomycetota bacterium]